MKHEPNKILLGASRSSFKEVDNRKGTIAAGLAVRLKNDGTLSVAASDGALLGVSFGRDLSNIGRTAICRKGTEVPVRLGAGFEPVVGAQVNFSDTTGEAVASGVSATAVNAQYASGKMTGIAEDGTEVSVALIDFPGGL